MAFATLRFEQRDTVAVITLNRPDAGNAIDMTMARELLEVAVACDGDETIRSVLLKANGKMFCAGGDINSFAAAGDGVAALISQEVAYLHAAVARFLRMDKPLVTAINGFAAGAGFSLAAMGDIVLMGETAQLTLAYTGIGLSPDGGASWLLPRLVGLRKAQQLFLDNPRLSAAQALDLGLVTEVVADAALEGAALDRATVLANGPTRAFARTRELLLSSYGQSLETHLELEGRYITANAASADGRAGIAAFREKRKPTFTGQP